MTTRTKRRRFFLLSHVTIGITNLLAALSCGPLPSPQDPGLELDSQAEEKARIETCVSTKDAQESTEIPLRNETMKQMCTNKISKKSKTCSPWTDLC